MADTFLSEHWNQFGVTSARDAIIVYLHALLLSEEFTQSSPSGEREQQQVLPVGWNTSQELYVIHYQLGDEKYLVKGLSMDDQLVINILSSDNQKVYTSYVNTMEHVHSDNLSSYPGVFKKLSQLNSQLKREIIHKIKPSAQLTASAHFIPPGRPPTQSHVTPDPLMVVGPRVPHHHGDPLREPNPFSVGEADRLPFGGAGGMLMDPFRQGRMPRLPQGVPPGARFDPYSPFHPSVPRGPRPPGQHLFG